MINTSEVDRLMKQAFTPAGAPPAMPPGAAGAPMPPGPGMMPTDPSMMPMGPEGGPMGAPLPPEMMMPPPPPAGMQIPPGMALIPVEALQAITGGGEGAGEERPKEEGAAEGSTKELSDRIELLETQLAELMNMLPQLLGMVTPPGGMAPGGAPASPEGLPIQGMPPEGMPPEGMPEMEPPPVPQLPTEGITPEERSTMSLIKNLQG